MKLVNDSLTGVEENRSVKTETLTRELSIEVAYNVRHLGDYETAAGTKTKGHTIFRSASLHRVTEQGAEAMAAAGVAAIIDLRSDEEVAREVTPDMARYGIRSVHAPVFQRDGSPAGLGQEEFQGYGFVYQRFLEIGAGAYRTLFETIADTEGGVLFHCAAGKDRTGVAAALLLEMAGVHDEHIVADYRLTEELLQPVVAEWLPKMIEEGMHEERAKALMAAPEEAIVTALTTLRERHGGAEGYLKSIGVSDLALSAVRARLVERAED